MRPLIFAALAAASVAAAGAAPALAQTVEGITVVAPYMPRGEPPARLSKVVDYSDLDLRLASDQDVLRHRVIDAAREVCSRLGEPPPSAAPLGVSCQDKAVRDAMNQMGVAVTYAMSRPAYAVAVPPPPVAAPLDEAPAAETYGESASTTEPTSEPAPTYSTQTVTNGPVPDTAQNRARYGAPMSRAGQHTAAAGN
jgi:UrcA family protein